MGPRGGFRLRGLVKTGFAWVLQRTGSDAWIGGLTDARRFRLVVGYHRVVEDFATAARQAIPAMLISRRMLERHLDWIGRRFRVISLDELGSQLECGEGFDTPVAAITFDDGYRDVYHQAFPLLKRKGLPAAVFVVTDLIGTSDVPLHDTLYHLFARAFARWRSTRELADALRGLGLPGPLAETAARTKHPLAAMRRLFTTLPQAEMHRVIEALEGELGVEEAVMDGFRPLSWEMLAEMQHGGITIGSHTKTHVLLPNERWRKVLEETSGSRQELERRLGRAVGHFAYPDGRFDAATVKAVATSGYRFGYTTCRHRDRLYPLLTIPRTLLWEKSCVDALGRFSPAIMSCHANGVFRGDCGQYHRVSGNGGAPRC